MKNKVLLLALLALCFNATSATASDLSIGIVVGQASFGKLGEVCDEVADDFNAPRPNPVVPPILTCANNADDSDTGLGVTAQYMINTNFGVEVGYFDLGDYSITTRVFRNTADLTVSTSALTAAGVISFPMSDSLSVSARIGGFSADIDLELGGEPAFINDEPSFYAGASVDYRFNERFSAQLRYDNFDLVDLVSVGFRTHF